MKTLGYIVLGNGKPMEWVVDRYNYGLYFGRSATLFKDYATARRRIKQDKRERGGMDSVFQLTVQRATDAK